ncbi:MAG: NAD(P)-dependent oxidoreductase [Treponemataceae bacterium]
MTKILITGASGNVGREVLDIFLNDKRFSCKILLREKKANFKLAKKLKDRVEIVWGDLRDFETCKNFLSGGDYLIHSAGIIPPASEASAKLTHETNVGATKNILEVLKDKNNIKLIYFSTYATYGTRSFKNPWGRLGDPLLPPLFDEYAKSKLIAERNVISSSLTWVSLRLPGVLYDNILFGNISDAIMFHTPWNTPIEWTTAESIAKIVKAIIVNDIAKNLPANFWRNIFNIGNGEGARVTGFETLNEGFKLMGKNVKSFFQPNWNPVKNFHCLWLEDSDAICKFFPENLELESFDEFFARLQKKFWFFKLGKPFAPIIKKLLIEPLLKQDSAPLQWIKKNDTKRIKAFWGSLEVAKSVPKTWEDFFLLCENQNPETGEFLDYNNLRDKTKAKNYRLNHGYDETKPNLSLEDLQKAAEFRGGKCLSKTAPENPHSPLEWECHLGHKFTLSKYAVLKGGFWCPVCMDSENYFTESLKHPYYKQIFK